MLDMNNHLPKQFFWLFLFIPILVGSRIIAEENPSRAGSTAGVEFFESQIRPLLATHCYQCHGPEEQEGQLRLDSYAGMIQGGKSGAAVVPQETAESLLVIAVGYANEHLKMPPDDKLTEIEIAKLTEWVAAGAPHPDEHQNVVSKKRLNLEAGRQFWSFQRPQISPVPAVSQPNWGRSGLDFYLLARLDDNQLTPAPAASNRTLIRRLTFNLIGLPPTAGAAARFAQDRSPDALARVTDRLLASPQYGERWARHWLDVVRYADSNGLDENIAHGNAWRYRDYVVNALNTDKSFDVFVREQIAGDLLAADDDQQRRFERLTATGFLSLGPKVLAEPDARKMEMDIIDEQLDTLCRSFLGITMGCARCHDHKFDPLSSADYYALAGIFKSTRTMENFRKVGALGKWWENSIATDADHTRKNDHATQLAAAQAEVAEFIKSTDAAVLAALPECTSPPEDVQSIYSAEAKAKLNSLNAVVTDLQASMPELPSAMGVQEGDIANLAVHIRGSYLTLGKVVPRRLPDLFAGTQQASFDTSTSGRLKFANWIASTDNPLTSRVIANRIWRWHFGQGLVGTTDNFGNLGERPVNQPLLDWLALELEHRQWSIKALHRTIVTSSSFAMSSQDNEAGSAMDPENRWQWRANLRRLEAESIRDAMLFVSGQLDRSMGGSLLHLKNRGYFFDHTSKDTTSYDSQRRSIYLPIVRNHLYDVFQLFDYSDAGSVVGHRTSSVVAPQALFMMNSPFMATTSAALAESLVNNAETNRQAIIQNLFQQAFSRAPSAVEFQNALDFLNEATHIADAEAAAEKEQEAWRLLCQVILQSNEFIYIE